MASFITKWRRAVRTVPDAKSSSPAALAQKRKQRRLLGITAAVVALSAAGFFLYNYLSGAPGRARKEMEFGLKKMGPGSYDRAIQDFDRAIAIDPDFGEAYLNRGLAEHVQGNTAAALVDLEKALDLNPNLVGAYNERGQIYLERGDTQKAIQDFDKSIQVKPTLDAFYQRAKAYEIAGQHQKAIADYDAAIQEFPASPYIYRARATAKRNQGDLDGATADGELADGLEQHATP